MTKRVYVEWQDASGSYLRAPWNFVDASTSAALLAAIQAQSNAGQISHVEGPLVAVAGVPVAAQYASLMDLAQLSFCTAANRAVRVIVPAPKRALFLADAETVDPAAAAAIIAAALGVLTDALGNPVQTYSGGLRPDRRKEQQ